MITAIKFPVPLTNKYIKTQSEQRRKKLRIILRCKCACVKCGAPDKLTIDHVKRKRDGAPKSISYRNAVALCVRCHEKKDKIPKQKRKK